MFPVSCTVLPHFCILVKKGENVANYGVRERAEEITETCDASRNLIFTRKTVYVCTCLYCTVFGLYASSYSCLWFLPGSWESQPRGERREALIRLDTTKDSWQFFTRLYRCFNSGPVLFAHATAVRLSACV